MSENKAQLVNTIKEWVALEKEMKSLNHEIKTRRQRKKELTLALIDTMRKNEIDCFDINDGRLVYSRNQVRAPLSKKHVIECLSKYFGDSPDERDKLAELILESREVKTKDNVRLKESKLK